MGYIQKHSRLGDIEFAWRFQSLELEPAMFTHEAHIRLAWIYIRLYGAEVAAEEVHNLIKAFVYNAGENEKYNTTVTKASVWIINRLMVESKIMSLPDFMEAHPMLIVNFKSLISKHYSMDVFNSAEAKREFIKPDLNSF